MAWKWNKIDGTKNTPDFDRQVLLVENRDGKYYAMVGSLKSIDKKGLHWALGVQSGNIFDIFGFNFPSTEENKDDEKAFTPTHWINVEVPKD